MTKVQFNRRSVVAGVAAVVPGRVAQASPSLAPGRDQFHRPRGAQPIVSADAEATFFCPMRNAPVRWRALHAFNPATVVHNGEVYMLSTRAIQRE